MMKRCEIFTFYNRNIAKQFKEFLKEKGIKFVDFSETNNNYIYEVTVNEKDLAIIRLYRKWLYETEKSTFEKYIEDNSTVYFKEVPDIKTTVTMRNNSNIFGYINQEKKTVYFYNLFSSWEKTYDLKYYETKKGNYIKYHGRRLYFDIHEVQSKKLISIRVIGGVEL